MTTPLHAVQMALDALVSYSNSPYVKLHHPKRHASGNKAIEALRTALAQPQAQPDVEGPSGDRLSDFRSSQWWLPELDAAVANGTDDQKRAVAVVRNLLNTVDALARPQAQPEPWQSIETAPKDETVILLSLPQTGALRFDDVRRVYEGRWNYAQETWTSVNGFLLHTGAIAWMPLPPAQSAHPAKPQHCGTSYCSCIECVMEPAQQEKSCATRKHENKIISSHPCCGCNFDKWEPK